MGGGRFIGACAGARGVLLTIALLVLGGTSAQDAPDSCVQVFDPSFVLSCPCDAGSEFIFWMEGKTTVTANVVRRHVDF